MKTNAIGVLVAMSVFAFTGAGCSKNEAGSAAITGAAGTIVAAKRTAVADTETAAPAATDSAAEAAAAEAAKGAATATNTSQADAEAAVGAGGSNAKSGKGDDASHRHTFKR